MSAQHRFAANRFVKNRRRNLLLAILLPLVLVLVGAWSVASTSQAAGRVPALIVNNDQMVEQVNKDGTTTPVVAGRLLVSWLTNPDNAQQYDWQLASPEAAQERLDAGTAYVVVTIPENFSASIVSSGTGEPQPATVQITTSQAHDYRTGEVAQQVFDGLVAEFGQGVTNQIAIGLADGVNESADGLQEAANGAGSLADGAGQLGDGFDKYADGAGQLAEGAGLSADGAGRLASGARDLDGGVRQYVDGVDEYVAGASQLAGGVSEYVGGVNSYIGGVEQYVDGVQQLDGGMQQLRQGAGELNQASSQIGQVATELEGASGQIDQARGALQQLEPAINQLAAIDTTQLYDVCAQVADPAMAGECTAIVDDLVAQIDAAGIDPSQLGSGFAQADEALQQLQGAGSQLQQLASGLGDFTDGVMQAADGSSRLSSGGDELLDGGAQLRSGGSDLASGADELSSGGNRLASAGAEVTDGTGQLASGANELAGGLDDLASGADELAEGGAPLSEGIDEIEGGARNMQTALQDGADQARSAITDTERFADMVSQPVRADALSLHDPGFAGMLASILLPLGAWVAGFVTAIRRRMVTDDLLDSSASNASILLAGVRRMFAPIVAVALALTLLVHLILGVPWVSVGGTLLFALLVAFASAALHLLLAVFWTRRNAAIVSLTLLLVQLIALRGVIPFEWRAPWVGMLSGFTPIGQAAAGLQAIYAGGTFASIFGAAAGLVLIAIAAMTVTVVAIGSRRKTSAASLTAA